MTCVPFKLEKHRHSPKGNMIDIRKLSLFFFLLNYKISVNLMLELERRFY